MSLGYHLALRSMMALFNHTQATNPAAVFRPLKLPAHIQNAVEVVQRRLMFQLYGVVRFLSLLRLRFDAARAVLAAGC